MSAVTEAVPTDPDNTKSITFARWLALGFLTLTLIVFLWRIFWISHPQDALSHPVKLQAGFSFEQQFQVSATAVYRIEFRFQRVLPFKRMKELLQKSRMIEIRLLKDGELADLHYIASAAVAPPALGFAPNWISQDIATFRGDPKAIYKLTCFVIRPVAELSGTHPVLFATLDPVEVEKGAVGSLLLLILFLLLAVLSVVFGIRFLKLRRRLKRG